MSKPIIFLITLFIGSACSYAQSADKLSSPHVDSLIGLVRSFTEKRDFDNAMSNLASAEQYTIEKIGKESAVYATCLHNRARTMLMFNRDKNEVEECYKEAVRLRAKFLGKFHPDYGASIYNLGSFYGQKGDISSAEPYILEAKEIFEKAYGKQHPLYAQSLNNLGIIYFETQRFEKAELCYLESKELKEKLHATNNIDYCGTLVNLGKLYYNMAYFEKAEPILLEAKNIFETILKNTNHPFYFNCLTALSLVYNQAGQFEKGELIILENLSLIEKSSGNNNEKYAGEVNNMGVLYDNMGNFDRAEKYYQKALEIKEKLSGKENINYVSTLSNLGILYGKTRDYQKSEKYLLESIKILESIGLTESPTYSVALNNLGLVYRGKNQFEEATQQYSKSLELDEKLERTNQPKYAMTLTNLGFLEVEKGNYDKAEVLYLKAKTLFNKMFTAFSPDYLINLFNLGELYSIKGDFVKSENFYSELSEANQIMLNKAVPHLSENELQKYLALFANRQDALFSMAHKANRTKNVTSDIQNKINSTCFNNNLFFKGFLLNVANQTRRLVSSDSVANEKYNRLNAYLRRLSAEYAKPKGSQNPSQITTLENMANELEKDIARNVNGYSKTKELPKWVDVQRKLKKEEAAIEFIHYRFYNNKSADSIMYAALILKPGDQSPIFVPLFESKSLEKLFKSKTEKNLDFVNNLYSIDQRGTTEVSKNSVSLYELIWKPMEYKLAGVKTIYLSPTGILHRINLNAIPYNADETLADRYNLKELNSTRELVTPFDLNIRDNNAVLYGGINYDKDTLSSNSEPIFASRSRGLISFSSIDSTLRGGSWNYLLGTEREVNAIGKGMETSEIKPLLLKGSDATEEAFKNLGSGKSASPRILHVATHGFFFPDPVNSEMGMLDNNEVVFKTSDNPMMRSGLLMAGANAAWRGKAVKDGMEDGILTAYEISQLNLSNTELVVLSACETGLGDIQGNEGVYGLQRAFKIAGAKYLIMSLWQVPDKQTSLLMTTFYNKWLKEKMTIPNAFNAAQKEMREMFQNPWFWAGFVLIE